MLVLKTMLFALLIPGTVAGVVPYVLIQDAPLFVWAFDDIMQWLGLLVGVAGAVLAIRCATDFVRFGHGTPAPIDPPKKLVTTGLYRYSRNPMYMGMVCLLLGEAILFRSLHLWIYTGMVAIGFHAYILLYEEPALRRRFGESYLEYCRTVPRWVRPMSVIKYIQCGLKSQPK